MYVWSFEELPNCFPNRLHYSTFPPAAYDDSNCSTSSPVLVINWLFDHSHPSGWGGISSWFLICISLMTNDAGRLFMYHFLTVYLLRRNVCSSPLSVFNWVIWSFTVALWVLIYSGHLTLTRCMTCNYLPFWGMSSHFLLSFEAKSFRFVF